MVASKVLLPSPGWATAFHQGRGGADAQGWSNGILRGRINQPKELPGHPGGLSIHVSEAAEVAARRAARLQEAPSVRRGTAHGEGCNAW